MFYLDNAATTWPKPEPVYQALDQSFRKMYSPKRGTATASRLGSEKLLEARQALADLFDAPDPARFCFTAGCTHALNIAIQTFPWQPGDGVIMSALEHHALSRPIRKMAREKGIHFHIIPYTDEAPFDLVVYETILRAESIRLVATTHASNVLGSVLPVEDIGRLAHQYGAYYLLDAAQSAGVLPVNLRSGYIDMMAVPGHKSLYGPPGSGALYIGADIPLNTFMEGGTGNDSGKHPMSPSVPEGFEVGTINMPAILAFSEGVRWVCQTGLQTIHRHETELLTLLLDGLQAMPEITIYGHTDPSRKTPVVSFNLQNVHPKALGNRLFDDYGIALRAGFHCAPMAHEAVGSLEHGGTVRASIGYYTQPEDIQALLKALQQEAWQESGTFSGSHSGPQ